MFTRYQSITVNGRHLEVGVKKIARVGQGCVFSYPVPDSYGFFHEKVHEQTGWSEIDRLTDLDCTDIALCTSLKNVHCLQTS